MRSHWHRLHGPAGKQPRGNISNRHRSPQSVPRLPLSFCLYPLRPHGHAPRTRLSSPLPYALSCCLYPLISITFTSFSLSVFPIPLSSLSMHVPQAHDHVFYPHTNTALLQSRARSFSDPRTHLLNSLPPSALSSFVVFSPENRIVSAEFRA
jgi:hypothetical protein